MKFGCLDAKYIATVAALKAVLSTTLSGGEKRYCAGDDNCYQYRPEMIGSPLGGHRPDDLGAEDRGRWILDNELAPVLLYGVINAFNFGAAGMTEVTGSALEDDATMMANVHPLTPKYAKDVSESNTTNTTWAQKLRLELPDTTEAADYLVAYTAQCKASANSTVYVQCELDDETIIADATETAETATDWMPFGGMLPVTLAAGEHTIDLDFKSSSSQKTVYIKNASIYAQKVT